MVADSQGVNIVQQMNLGMIEGFSWLEKSSQAGDVFFFAIINPDGCNMWIHTNKSWKNEIN